MKISNFTVAVNKFGAPITVTSTEPAKHDPTLPAAPDSKLKFWKPDWEKRKPARHAKRGKR